MSTSTKTEINGSANLLETNKEERDRIFEPFRQWGYLESDLDPLGFLPPQPHPELQVKNELARSARAAYCGTVGLEFGHIADPERRRWLQEKMEGPQD